MSDDVAPSRPSPYCGRLDDHESHPWGVGSKQHALVGQRCTCGEWEAPLGKLVAREFDKHLLFVRQYACPGPPTITRAEREAVDKSIRIARGEKQ